MSDETTAAEDAAAGKAKRKRIGAAVFTILLAVGAVLAFFFRDDLNEDGLRGVFGLGGDTAAESDEFTYEIGSGQVFAVAGNDLAVATASSIQLLDAAGRTVFKQVVSYDTPAVIGTAWGALFCDLGGTACVPVRADGEVRTLHPAGKLITANMNDNGYVALTTEAAGYKALVTVYDAADEARYQWWSGTGYVLKACVSPDDQLLAVLCAETDGGKLHVFRMDSETELASAAFPGELPFDLAFLGNDTLCAVSEEAFSFFAADGSLKNRFDLGQYYLLDYDLSSQSFAAVYVSAYRTASGGLLETLGLDGRLLGYAEIERDVTSLSAAGQQVLAMTAAGITVYDRSMEALETHEGLVTAKKAVLRADGAILLLSAYAAEKID